MPELLLLGVGIMGRPYLAAAGRLGVRVHVVETPARAQAIAGEADRLTLADGEADVCWAEAAAAAVATHRPDGVLAFTEPQVLAAALVAEELSLPGPSLRAAVVSRNKALQRGRFVTAGVRQPEYVIAANLADAVDWAAQRFPVVVKSVSGSGSDGVELVADAAEFAATVARRGGESPLLVERAVEGPEYSWEALVADGRIWLANITTKETTGPPHFVEIGHRTGTLLDPARTVAVEEFATAVLGALGMRTGVVHLEFRLAQDGPTLMEVAVRTPGDYLMELLGASYGIDWFEMAVRLALSMPLPEPPRHRPTPAAGYFPVVRPGVVAAIDGLEEVRAHPAVRRAGVLAAVGDILPPVVASHHRRVFVLLSGRDDAEIDDALRFAARTLAVRTRPV